MDLIFILALVLVATLLLNGKAEGHSEGGCRTKKPPKTPKPSINPKPYGKSHLKNKK